MTEPIYNPHLLDHMPEDIKKWLDAQRAGEREEDVNRVLDDFERNIKTDIFLNEWEIAEISAKLVAKEFSAGGFTKLWSKKMRAKIDKKVLLKHLPLRQTTVFVEILASNRKRIGYKFSVVNYFKSPGGYIYVLRHGVPYPAMFIFTGHFFDRALQRGLKTTDQSARMVAIFRLLRQLDRKSEQNSKFIYPHLETRQVYLSALGGLCLGTWNEYTGLSRIFDFTSDTFTSNNLASLPKALAPPKFRPVFFFLTFIGPEMFDREQNYIYHSLLQKKGPL